MTITVKANTSACFVLFFFVLFKGGAPEAKKPADDDDIDLFGDDDEEEDEEKKRLHEERVKMYAAKKGNKPVLIAKSCVKLDVKPWDDETDMKEMENKVRGIVIDGLVWGSCTFSSFTANVIY